MEKNRAKQQNTPHQSTIHTKPLKNKQLTVINRGVENLFEKYLAKKWGNVEEIVTFVLKFQIRQFFNAFYRRISS